MESLATNKRSRESDSSEDVSESPEAKRIREDLLLDILDADGDATVPGDGGDSDETNDLASVMRIFEEEIALLPSDPENPVTDLEPEPEAAPRQPDLGYLLEASDDELGLPPPSSERETEAEVEVVSEEEPTGFGKIWGYGDEIYEPLDFGLDRAAGGIDDGAVFEEGLFEYSDAFCQPVDFADLAWRPESLPAV